jgi:hypothetical protein
VDCAGFNVGVRNGCLNQSSQLAVMRLKRFQINVTLLNLKGVKLTVLIHGNDVFSGFVRVVPESKDFISIG